MNPLILERFPVRSVSRTAMLESAEFEVVRAIAQVVDVVDGIVHVRPVKGSVASNAHLLSETRGSRSRVIT